MLRVFVILAIATILYLLWRSVQKAVYEWRNPQDIVPQIILPASRLDAKSDSWQLVIYQDQDTAHIRVEHPTQGLWHEWKINLNHLDAQRQIDKAIENAQGLISHLDGDDPNSPVIA